MKMSIDTDQGEKLFIVQTVCLVIVWFVITPLRVYSRVLSKRREKLSWKQTPWLEDALMFASLVRSYGKTHMIKWDADVCKASIHAHGWFRTGWHT